ncbi:acyl-CoA carboxylase subunit epsilon [Streptomyces sp. NPDC047000]|uniref:acyl-CoA carboxylase subunit epsilon n=1 Tax=Streptomyces sp. NPDC047000 TaxID=3155474 RepID=UPI0033F9D1F3
MDLVNDGGGASALRVERGQASEEELAAITVVLLALRAGGTTDAGGRPGAGRARWRNGPDTYKAPHSWR